MAEIGWKAQNERAAEFPKVAQKNVEKVLFAFDFDGTLAHMDDDPEAVQMVPLSGAAIERLAGGGVKIAIISGRPVETLLRLGDLESRGGFSEAILLGQYGIERYDMATGRLRDPQAPATIRDAKGVLEALVAGHPGSHLEDKGRALAVHVRQMENPDDAFEELEAPVRKVAGDYGLTLEPGRYVWELRASSTDKGEALAELVEELDPKVVMMAGDDLGDLAAFEYLDTLDGVETCRVVSASAEQPDLEAQADVLCDGPDGVAAWLEHVADRLGS